MDLPPDSTALMMQQMKDPRPRFLAGSVWVFRIVALLHLVIGVLLFSDVHKRLEGLAWVAAAATLLFQVFLIFVVAESIRLLVAIREDQLARQVARR